MDPADQDLDALPTSEIVALCLGGRASREEAERLCARFELAELCRATPDHLRRSAGVERTRARRLAAAFALGRRVEKEERRPRPALRSPSDVQALLAGELRGAAQETFHALLLDGKHRLRRREQVSLGTLTSSLVHPREVFGPAVREAAAALIVAHNHPSGDPDRAVAILSPHPERPPGCTGGLPGRLRRLWTSPTAPTPRAWAHPGEAG